MSKPETERQEESIGKRISKHEHDVFKKGYKSGIRYGKFRVRKLKEKNTPKGKTISLDEVIKQGRESHRKNQTAVTFYIPKGMSFGTALMVAFRDRFIDENQIISEVSYAEIGQGIQDDICKATPKQIQEAIDNTFTENK